MGRSSRLWYCPLLVVFTPIAVAMGAGTQSDEIPPFTPTLEQRLQPWCPEDCKEGIPFTASYRTAQYVLVFVGARHVFTPKNSTLRAVDSAFVEASPAIVIVEGFPTAMGESPPPLVKEVKRRGTPDATQFTDNEAIYAASLALSHGIPFLGGEPTRAEDVEALVRKGFARTDISFAFALRGLVQSLNAGEITNVRDSRLPAVFERASQATAHEFGLNALSFDDFSRGYRALFRVDIESETDLSARAEPGTGSPVARLLQSDMVARDEHLWATIQRQLDLKKRVLVVYGGSHWTTLSGVLERKLGKPRITRFINDGAVGATNQSNSTAADKAVERDRAVLLIFGPLNRRVWVLDASKTDVHAIEGLLPKPTVGRNGAAVYLLRKPLVIEIRGTRIDFSETRIELNGQTMGSSQNAVVSKDGQVSIGAFIRDFD